MEAAKIIKRPPQFIYCLSGGTNLYAFHTIFCTLCQTNQINSNAGSYDVSHVDVCWVTSVLSDLRQASEACCHAESKDEQRLQELRSAVDAGVEIHLHRETNTQSIGKGQTFETSETWIKIKTHYDNFPSGVQRQLLYRV